MNRKTLITIFAWLIPILISIYLFILSEKKREPVYTVINSPSLIFDKTNAIPRIKLLFDDTLLLKNNVFVTTIGIWNNGNLSISKEDVRQKFYIFCSEDSSKILDYKIVEELNSQTNNFRTKPVGDSLEIGWDYFDPQYGFKIQIIYSGNKNEEIKITGSVLDNIVEQIPYKTKDRLKPWRASFVIAGLMFLIIIIMCNSVPYPHDYNNKNAKLIAIAFTISVLLLYSLIFILNFKNFFATTSPF